MGRTISIGAQSFEFIRKNDYFFIDKTGHMRGVASCLRGCPSGRTNLLAGIISSEGSRGVIL